MNKKSLGFENENTIYFISQDKGSMKAWGAHCDKAKAFLKLTRNSIFMQKDIKAIRELGYTIRSIRTNKEIK